MSTKIKTSAARPTESEMFASAPQLPKLDAITKKKASTFTEKGGGGSSKASGGQIALFGQNKLSLGF